MEDVSINWIERRIWCVWSIDCRLCVSDSLLYFALRLLVAFWSTFITSDAFLSLCTNTMKVSGRNWGKMCAFAFASQWFIFAFILGYDFIVQVQWKEKPTFGVILLSHSRHSNASDHNFNVKITYLHMFETRNTIKLDRTKHIFTFLDFYARFVEETAFLFVNEKMW